MITIGTEEIVAACILTACLIAWMIFHKDR
jgi:hypothetical protein